MLETASPPAERKDPLLLKVYKIVVFEVVSTKNVVDTEIPFTTAVPVYKSLFAFELFKRRPDKSVATVGPVPMEATSAPIPTKTLPPLTILATPDPSPKVVKTDVEGPASVALLPPPPPPPHAVIRIAAETRVAAFESLCIVGCFSERFRAVY